MDLPCDDISPELIEKIQSLRGPILVLGASGFVGANLVRRLAAVRDDVTGTASRLPAWRLAGLPETAIRQFDSFADSQLDSLLEAVDPKTVFDCIGYGGYPFETDAERIYATNFGFLARFLPRLASRAIAAYIHAGSSSEYGINAAGPSEQDFASPNSEYAVSKLAASHLIQFYGQRRELRCANLRLYSTYGPMEEASRLIPQVVQQGVAGKLPNFVHPDISRDFLFVDDACSAFVHAALYLDDSNWGESFNIGTGQKTTITMVASLAQQMFQIEAQPAYTMPARGWDVRHWFANIERARTLLHWQPQVEFRHGLERTLAWYRGLRDPEVYGRSSKANVATEISLAGAATTGATASNFKSNWAISGRNDNEESQHDKRRPHLAIGMITCARANVDVHEAIHKLRFGGFHEVVHLFCEPGTPPLRLLEHVIEHHNATRRGVLGNWSYCLRWLLDHTLAEYLMVCEDDVAYCRGARAAWERSTDELTSVGFWSLYTPRRDRERVGHSAGWVASNRGRDAWGTQCMCFPRSSAERVLEYRPLQQEDQMRGPTDAIVAQCFVDARIPCYYHNPSLADHLGRVSSIGHNWYEDHVGFDFDPEFQALREQTA